MAVPTPGDGTNQDQNWPLPKFYFSVDIGEDTELPFQEVSGLDTETDVIEYRHGNSPVHSTIKMPGLIKSSNVTMKKGVFNSDNQFFEWFDEIQLNTIKRRTVIIKLLNEDGDPQMVWTLKNAFPCKVTGTDLNSQSSEVAVETIEFAHEGLTISLA